MPFIGNNQNEKKEYEKSAYQQNVSQPIEIDKPVQSARQETLGKIYKIAETNPEQARNLYGLYEESCRTPGTPVYNQYAQPTNRAVGELAKYGINANGMTTDWFKNNNSWQQYLIYNGTTNTPSKPGKKASDNEWKAYWTYQIYKNAEDTDKADREWSALKQELTWKAKNPGRNDSDDEIINGIDWKKYPTLAKMQETEGINPVELNRGIGFSKDDMYGTLWAARNGYEGDNSDYAIAMGALGQGNVWQENAELRAKLNWNNRDTYSPYSVGMTLGDDVGMYFNMTSFNADDIERLRQTIDPNDATATAMFDRVLSAWENTQKAEAELKALEDKIEFWVNKGKDKETVLKLTEKYIDNNCPTLTKMDESIQNGSKLVETTRAIDYKRKDFLNIVSSFCDEAGTKLKGEQFVSDIEKDAAPVSPEPKTSGKAPAAPATPKLTEQEKAIIAEQNKALSDAGDIVDNVGTPTEKAASTYSWTATFDMMKNAVQRVRDSFTGQANGLIKSAVKSSISDTANAILTGSEVIASYEQGAAKLDEINKRCEEIEASLGDLIYSGMNESSFSRGSVEVNVDGVPRIVRAEYNNRTGEYEITSIARKDGVKLAADSETFNRVMEEAQKRFAGVKETRDRAMSVAGIALSDEEQALLNEYKTLTGQRNSLVQSQNENTAAYNEAKDKQAAAEAKRTAVISMMEKAGVPAEELKVFEETGAVIDVLNGFTQYDPTVWESFNAYDLYAQAIAFEGADSYDKVFADAKEGDAKNRQELETALWVLDYSERMGIDIPDNIKGNINRYIAKLERDHKDFEYFSALQSKDFKEMAQRGRDRVAAAGWDWDSYDGNLDSQPAWNMLSDEQKDQLLGMMDAYDINDIAATFENMVANNAGDPVEDRLFGMFLAGNLMSNYEIDTYYYLLAKEGQEAADAYYNHLADSSYGALTVRSRDALEAGAKDLADQGFWGRRAADALSVIQAPAAAFGSFAYGVEYGVKKLAGQEVEYNPNNPWLSFNQFRTAARSEIQAEITRTYGEGSVAEKIFSTMQEVISNRFDSMANMMAFGWLTGGMTSEMAQEFIGALPMAAGAAADVMAQAKERGASDAQAWMVGSIALLCEAGTEAISIENISKAFKIGQEVEAGTVKEFLKNWVTKAGWSEALGESANDFFENVADEAFMGPLSEHSRRVAELKEADPNMTDEEAEAQARREEFSSILHTAITSFLSPGMDVIPLAAGRVNYLRAQTKFAKQHGTNVNIFDVMKADKAIREQGNIAAANEVSETMPAATEQTEQAEASEAAETAEVETVEAEATEETAQAEPEQQAPAEQETEEQQQAPAEEKTEELKLSEKLSEEEKNRVAADIITLEQAKKGDSSTQTAAIADVLKRKNEPWGNQNTAAAAFATSVLGENAIDIIRDTLIDSARIGGDLDITREAIQYAILGNGEATAAINSEEFKNATRTGRKDIILTFAFGSDFKNDIIRNNVRSKTDEFRKTRAEADKASEENADIAVPEEETEDEKYERWTKEGVFKKPLAEYSLLLKAKNADAKEQTALLAGVFDEDGTDGSSEIAKATATALHNFLSDNSLSKNISVTVDILQNLWMDAEHNKVDISTLKQALCTAVLGGENSAAYKALTSIHEDGYVNWYYANANRKESIAQKLVKSVEQDSADAAVQENISKVVREYRVAEAEGRLIAENAEQVKVQLAAAKSLQKKADDAANKLLMAKDLVKMRQRSLEESAEAVQRATQTMNNEPSKENKKALTSVLAKHEGKSIAYEQAKMQVESLTKISEDAAEASKYAQNEAMDAVRKAAEQLVAQEDQQRQQAAEQQQIAQEQAAIEQQQRQAAQESSENALNADVDTLIEQDFPNATEEQKDHIREIAKQAYDEMQKEAVAATGKVSVDELLNRKKVLNRLGKRYNFNVEVRDTTEGGKTFFSEGYFDRNTNTLVLDTSTTLQQAMYKVLGHELTHIAEQSQTYSDLANALLQDAYGEGVSFDGILSQMEAGDFTSQLAQDILEKKQTYDKTLGEDHSYKYMLEEVVADRMGDILNGDQELINRLAQEKPNVIRRIIESIKNFLKKNKGIKGEWQTESQRIVDMLETALKEANNKPTPSAESEQQQTKAIAKDGNGDSLAIELPGGTVSLDSGPRYSLKTFTEEEQERVRQALYKAEDENGNKRFTKDEVDNYLENAQGIASMISEDKARLDFEANPAQKFLKPNSDYYFTLDASTLCAKRLLYQGTFDYVQHELPDEVFTPEDLIDLVNIMSEMGYETPCGICYVESRRRWLDTYAREFLDKTPKDVDTFVEKRFKKAPDEEKAALRERLSGEMPSIEDLTTSDGLENLRVNDPLMHKAFVAAMNAKGTANPKVVQLRTAYNGDIGTLSDKDVQKVKDIGGLRIQSFSDFETPHLLDMIQAVYDMSAVGLTSQAYTKVPNFAWVFGDTGIKINLSLIGKGTGIDENGNLVFDNVEGMNFDEAMRLRDRYSQNVGTILVGINDDHIVAAMSDPRIDYIIPFHKSGWSDNELKGIASLRYYQDYTDSQNEKKLFGKDKNGEYVRNSDGTYKTVPGKESKLKNFEPVGAHKYWEFDHDGEWNARKYLQMCKEDGRIPKFSQFLVDNGDGSFSLPEGDDPRSTAIRTGYWKTLIDFKMYDNAGNGAEQKAVTPNINMDQAQRVLNEHKLGRQMPDRPDGTKGKFIPMESNNSVPVAVPAGDEFIERIRRKREKPKPTKPNDYLEATPVLDVSKLGKSYFHQADNVAQSNQNASTAAMASGADTVLGNTASEQGEYNAQRQNAMAIDADTGETTNRRFSLPSRPADAPYMAAVERGETDEAKRMVDEAAKEAGYVDNAYHGTDRFGFTEFDMEESRGMVFVAYDEELASSYALNSYVKEIGKTPITRSDMSNASPQEILEAIKSYEGFTYDGAEITDASYNEETKKFSLHLEYKNKYSPLYGQGFDVDATADLLKSRLNQFANRREQGTYEFYTRPGNQYVVDAKDAAWNNIYDYNISNKALKTRDIGEWARKNGYDSVRINNVFDNGGFYRDLNNELDSSFGDIGIFFNANDIKSADAVTYDSMGRVIPPSERFSKQSNDIRYDIPSDKYLQQKIRHYLENGGSAAPLEGENPTMSTAQGPKERAFGGVNGMLQNSDEIDRFAKVATSAQNTYFPDTNESQINRAVKWIGSLKQTQNSDGYAEALQAVASDDFDYRSADGQARMVAVMGMAVAKKDSMAQAALADAFNRQGTDIGRMMQSRKLFMLMTPEGRQQTLRNMLRQQQAELGKRGKNIELKFSDWIYQAAAAAEGEGEMTKVRDAAINELAEQIPANWKDRVRSLRMLSMLANPRTHIRNIIGNMMFVPAVSLKNKLGAVGEIVTRRKDRSKTLWVTSSKDVRDFARKDADSIKDVLTGEAKFSEAKMIRKAQSKLGRALDWLSEKNSNALEKEDWFFLKGHYRRALGGWMTANGYTVERMQQDAALLEKGRQYAINEAQKATYRDFSKAASILNDASRKGGVIGFTVDAALPFKKTPANILKRGMEYSPAGIIKSLTVDMYHMKQYLNYQKGKLKVMPDKALSPTQVIDHICSGLSGTAITALGFLLAGTGTVTCGFGDDEDELKELEGQQEYAIHARLFGEDVSFTLDWAAPMSMPFFVGAAIRSQLEQEGEIDIERAANTLGAIAEPVFNLSFLDGVNTLLNTKSYDETNPITQIASKLATNYVSSYVPSALGAITRTFFDDKQRKAFVEQDKNKGIIGNVRYMIEQAENKIPGLSKNNIAARDIWGEEKTTGFLERLLENFILPGYVNINDIEGDPILNEMGRLYESRAEGYKSMIPKEDPDKKISWTKFGEKHEHVLTDKQWDRYKEVRNKTAHSDLTALIESEAYQKSNDAERIKMIDSVWKHADSIGKNAVFPEYEAEEKSVSDIARDGKLSSLKSEIVKSLNAEDYEAYDAMVEAIRAEYEDEDEADAAIKTKIGNTYRDQWKDAYKNGDDVRMLEIEDILEYTGFNFNIYGKGGWQEKVDDESDQ